MKTKETKSRPFGASDKTTVTFKTIHWFTTALGVLIGIMCFLVVSGNVADKEEDRSSVFIKAPAPSVAERLSTATGPAASAILAIF